MELDAGLGMLPQLLRQRMRAEADTFAAIASHGTIVGTAREIALANFFRGLIPKRYEVLSGAVAATRDGKLQRATNQLDVMLVDTFAFPTLLRSGDLAVALAASVLAVIESKSDLEKGEVFYEAIKQIAGAKVTAGSSTFTALFCFGAPAKSGTLRTWLLDLLAHRKNLGEAATNWSADGAPKKQNGKPYSQKELWERQAVFSASNLPDLIVSDGGAIARLDADPDGGTVRYGFYKATEKGGPTIVALAAETLRRISGGIEVDGQPRVGGQIESLQILTKHFDEGFTSDDEIDDVDVTDAQPEMPDVHSADK